MSLASAEARWPERRQAFPPASPSSPSPFRPLNSIAVSVSRGKQFERQGLPSALWPGVKGSKLIQPLFEIPGTH